MKKFGALILTVLILAFSLTSCGPRFLKKGEILNIENPTGKITIGIYDDLGELVEDLSGTFEFELYYRDAPNTVANFISLVESGYYEGKSFEMPLDDSPFVIFGEQEFYDELNDDDVQVKGKRKVEPAYNIIGEFFNNGYWDKNEEPRNKQESGIGSMIMMREENKDDPKTKYNTAYAGFRVQTETSTSIYHKSYCVFGKITKLPNGQSYSAGLHQQLVGTFFENDMGFTDNYNGTSVLCKFMIMDVEINYPQGATKDDFKPRKIKV